MLESLNLETLIPSAVILSVFAFLINFFGKAITDQTPFADDRKWNRELNGLLFFVFHILVILSGVLIFISSGFNLFRFTSSDWMLLLIVIIVILTTEFTKKKAVDFFLRDKSINDKDYIWYIRIFTVLTFIIILLLISYYNWKEHLYIVPSLGLLLVHLLDFALITSLRKENIGIADIYFIDGKKPIKDCRVLKVNDDNIRIRKGKFSMIINKSQIFKIEEKVDFSQYEKKNKDADSIVSRIMRALGLF